MLDIEAEWSRPMPLVNGSKSNMIYDLPDKSKLPPVPGAYLFARIHGAKIVPIYIGETENLSTRLDQHLNDVSMMMGLKNAPTGARVFMYCKVTTKKGQQLSKVLNVLQKALIEHALSEGHELLNTQLTKTRVNEITFKGNRDSEKVFPCKMYIK
jgi:hypothetical protein